MCGRGRFVLTTQHVAQAVGGASVARLRGGDGAEGLGDTENEDGFDDSFLQRENFGPGMVSLICCLNSKGEKEIRKAHWGLVRATYREPLTSSSFFSMFNARSDRLEVVHSKLLGKKHCVVLFNGFFEWKKEVDPLTKKETRQPYYCAPKDGGVLRLAGLYDEILNPETGRTITTYTIITVDSAPSLTWLHDRMPVVLSSQASIDAWLSPDAWGPTKRRLLAPDNNALTWHPVTKSIGSTKFQDEACSRPVKLAKPLPKLTQFWSKAKSEPKSEPKSESQAVKEEPQCGGDTLNLKREERLKRERCSGSGSGSGPILKQERVNSAMHPAVLSHSSTNSSPGKKRPRLEKGQKSLADMFNSN